MERNRKLPQTANIEKSAVVSLRAGKGIAIEEF
jgi:hypothetical protein